MVKGKNTLAVKMTIALVQCTDFMYTFERKCGSSK